MLPLRYKLVKPFAKLGEFWFILAGTSTHRGRSQVKTNKREINIVWMDSARYWHRSGERVHGYLFSILFAHQLPLCPVSLELSKLIPQRLLASVKLSSFRWNFISRLSLTGWRDVYKGVFSENPEFLDVASIWIFHVIHIYICSREPIEYKIKSLMKCPALFWPFKKFSLSISDPV